MLIGAGCKKGASDMGELLGPLHARQSTYDCSLYFVVVRQLEVEVGTTFAMARIVKLTSAGFSGSIAYQNTD